MADIPAGYCQCGCGERTVIASHTDRRAGYTRGESKRYLHGHYLRGLRKTERYREEDRGYDTPCWVWLLSENGTGYGKTVNDEGRLVLAHRHIYEQYRGPIPEGLELDHLCRVRPCVNPEHLEPVTHLENCRRGNAGRRKLTVEQVTEIRASSNPSPTALGREYGVDRHTIMSIRAGRTWKHQLSEAA